jgi:Tat protein translocase TatB subunit
MLDFGLTKICIIAAVALIVIGPEKLPATAKTLGILWARVQNYMFKLKQEVHQHIDLSEIKKIQQNALGVGQSIQNSIHNFQYDMREEAINSNLNIDTINDAYHSIQYIPKSIHGRYSWRIKQCNTPVWYKHKNKQRMRIQNGAARMQRFTYKKTTTKNYFNF